MCTCMLCNMKETSSFTLLSLNADAVKYVVLQPKLLHVRPLAPRGWPKASTNLYYQRKFSNCPLKISLDYLWLPSIPCPIKLEHENIYIKAYYFKNILFKIWTFYGFQGNVCPLQCNIQEVSL